ncbi:IS607 family transposase [Desulfobacterales bacterium HSG2]|nr:IS607 family transposase [Desulfobacterales bacterium HSG2]
MKAQEVLKILRITRPTLTKYVKEGKIKAVKKPNGFYEYDEHSVYTFFNKDVQLKTIIYARVSTSKQKTDLSDQIELLKTFCIQNGWKISAVYQDIANGVSFEKRSDFFKMLDDILDYKIERVVITYKDRLSRVGFELFYHLFRKFGAEIVVLSEVGSEKLDSQEIFEEIVSLLHCYSMKLYSKHREKNIEELCRPIKNRVF